MKRILLWVYILLSFNYTIMGNIRKWYEYTGLDMTLFDDKNISLSKLIRLIPNNKSNKVAINIGARDGIDHDPVYELYQNYSYIGICFEGDIKMLPILRDNMKKVNDSGKIHIIEEFAKVNKMELILNYYSIPKDLDVLKVDIDSYDYAILKRYDQYLLLFIIYYLSFII